MVTFTTNYTRVNEKIVKATLALADQTSQEVTVPILVLDTSGSMGGSRIKNCLASAKRFIKECGSIHLLTYDTRGHDHGIISDESELEKIRASGGTYFRAAYETIVNITSDEGRVYQIIFFTDGEDTMSGSVPADREWLKSKLKGKKCVIHTIGIESQSHTQHMLDLSRCGSSDGTYGYFSTRVENSYSSEVDRLIADLTPKAEVHFHGQNYLIGSRPVEVYLEDSESDIGEPDTFAAIDYLSYCADQLIRKGNKASIDEIEEIRAHAQTIFNDSGREPRLKRKMLRERPSIVYDLVGEFFKMMNGRNITHEKLALLSVSARNARSDRFTKKVVNRTDQNIAVIEREDRDLLLLTEELSRADLGNQPDELVCMISCMNTSELLGDGDCIGIGIRATARETCIVDPTLLQVDGISTSNFGCSAFLEAAQYAVKYKDVQYGDSTNVILDSSRMEVSGVLPLYLNETHWKVAKLYLRRMAGHLCCKDPLLGTNRVIFYSYLHAYRFCRSQDGEFFGRMAGLLRDTLERVYEKMPNIIPTPDSFCDSISQRMPDSVPSIPLLEEAYSALSLASSRKFLKNYIVEEELRRKKFFIQIQDLCVIPHDTWITPFVRANSPNLSNAIFGNILSYVKSNYPDAFPLLENTISGESQQTPSAETVDVPVIDPETYSPVISLPGWMDNMFVDLSPERRALIAFQVCALSNVTSCIENYRDIFAMTEEDVHSALKDRAVDYIELRRTSELTSAITSSRKNATRYHTSRLLQGVSLLERVAILHGNCYIGRNISEFVGTATTPEELKMLVSGSYDIAPLINSKHPVIVPTVMDISKYHSIRLPELHYPDESRYSDHWIPNLRQLRKFCVMFHHDDLVSIMPQAKSIFDMYCS